MAKSDSPQTAFDNEFRGHIERFSGPLFEAVRKITSTAAPLVVKVLVFETYSDWRGFPVQLFAMSGTSPDEVYFEPPFSGEILSHVGDLIPSSQEEWALDQDAYEEAGVDTFSNGAQVMAEWFGECWHQAGGARMAIPTYFHHHDRSDYYDLRERKWVQHDVIWS